MQAASGHLPRSGAEELQKCSLLRSWPFLSLCSWVFVQEREILVLAVRPGDKASSTGGGRCFFPKRWVSLGGREGTGRNCLGEMFCLGEGESTRHHSWAQLYWKAGKRWAVWRDPKLGEGKCTHPGCSGRDQHSDRNVHFQRKNRLLFYHPYWRRKEKCKCRKSSRAWVKKSLRVTNALNKSCFRQVMTRNSLLKTKAIRSDAWQLQKQCDCSMARLLPARGWREFIWG